MLFLSAANGLDFISQFLYCQFTNPTLNYRLTYSFRITSCCTKMRTVFIDSTCLKPAVGNMLLQRHTFSRIRDVFSNCAVKALGRNIEMAPQLNCVLSIARMRNFQELNILGIHDTVKRMTK